MNGRLAVREVVKSSPLGYAEVARELGYSGNVPERWLSSKLANRKDLGLGFAARILDVVGYKLVIMPKGRRAGDGCIEVGFDDVQ